MNSSGFRDCAAEVARYLIAVEGLDEIRIRLMSHLQMFLNQKEFSNQAAVAAAAVSASSLQRGYNGQTTNQTPNQYTNQTWNAYSGYYETGVPKPSDSYQISPDALSYFAPLPPPSSQLPHSSLPSSTSIVSSTTSVSSPSTQTSNSLTALTSAASAEHWNNGFGVHNNNQAPSNNHQFSAFTASNSSQTHNAYGKPYRPWGGAEMAC